MKIAILDYIVTPNSPAGSLHLKLINALCLEHEFVVFAPQFENPDPERIRHVVVPAPLRPLPLMFIVFHLMAPICVLAYQLRHRMRFDLIQAIESNYIFPDLVYSHFCHYTFRKLKLSEEGAPPARRWSRWLDHWLRSLIEPLAYRQARCVVTVSPGLRRDLEREFPWVRDKTVVIPNPIPSERMRAPDDFDRAAFRRSLGIPEDAVLLSFIALGHFERKGLPILLEALKLADRPELALIVGGGDPSITQHYRRLAERIGVSSQVFMVGFQSDVKPLLWSADAFVLPSSYEAAPLVCLEAAAAQLPLIVTRLSNIEDFVRDGENAFVIDRTAESLASALRRFAGLSPNQRRTMGERAAAAVTPYKLSSFIQSWQTLYSKWTLNDEKRAPRSRRSGDRRFLKPMTDRADEA